MPAQPARPPIIAIPRLPQRSGQSRPSLSFNCGEDRLLWALGRYQLGYGVRCWLWWSRQATKFFRYCVGMSEQPLKVALLGLLRLVAEAAVFLVPLAVAFTHRLDWWCVFVLLGVLGCARLYTFWRDRAAHHERSQRSLDDLEISACNSLASILHTIKAEVVDRTMTLRSSSSDMTGIKIAFSAMILLSSRCCCVSARKSLRRVKMTLRCPDGARTAFNDNQQMPNDRANSRRGLGSRRLCTVLQIDQ